MARKQRYTSAQVAAALTAAGGIYSEAAKRLGCTPATVRNYVKRYKALQKLEGDIVEQRLDLAERGLLAKIHEGNLTAIMFYLRTKGRGRGYRQRRNGEAGPPASVRAPATAPVPDLSKLTDEELDILERLLEKATAGAGGHSAGEGEA